MVRHRFFLSEDGKLTGLFGVADQVKADSADMVAALHQMGKGSDHVDW